MQIYLHLFKRIFVNKNAKAKIKLKSHYVLCLLLNLVINKLNNSTGWLHIFWRKDATFSLTVFTVVMSLGIMFYAIGRELFSGQSPSGVYSKAFKLCKKHEKVCSDIVYLKSKIFSCHAQ